MQNISMIGHIILELCLFVFYVNPKLGQNGQDLTFDLLPPRNKNFQKYDINAGLSPSIASKMMLNSKKI